MKPIVSLEDCKKIIARYNISEKETPHVLDFQVTPLSETPLGFLGDHLRLRIKYQTENGEEQTNFFLKTLPRNNPDHAECVKAMGVFKKECLLYKNILAEFSKYHKEKMVPENFLIDENNFMVLEDLSSSGYRVYDDEEIKPYHWECLMRTMAKFHASTIIYEEKRSVLEDKPSYRISENHATEVKETTFSLYPDHPRYKWAKTTSKSVADSMQVLDDTLNPEIGEEFIKFATEDIFKYLKPSGKYRNVINHADLWKNNIMFNKDNNDHCVLVDFQLARYSPPALDLLTALHVNCSSSFLALHMDRLLKIYHETFSVCLKRYDINPDSVLSWGEFLDSLEYYKMASLTEAVMFGTIVFVGEDLTSKIVQDERVFHEFTFVNRSKYVLKEMETNRRFRMRFSDIVFRLIDCLKEKRGICLKNGNVVDL